jgi:integrase
MAGVGRLKVASGTTNVQTYKRIVGMVDALKAAGRLDLLRAMKERVVTPLEVWDAYRLHDLDSLPSAETIRLLWGETGALEAWRAALDASAKHKASMVTSFAALQKIGRAEATITDLPELVTRYRKLCESKGHARSFNLARSHVQAFLRDTTGRSHRLYRKIADLKTLPIDRSEGNPLRVKALDDLLAKLPSATARAAEAMAMTGMGPGEYWGRWTVEEDRIRIHGTKRAGRKRLVPKVIEIERPTLHPRTFANHLTALTAGEVTAYDFRRTYAHFMEEAGIPRARRKLYMGHAAGDVTDLYERHEVQTYLIADAAKLRAYLANQRSEIPT